ncbi:ceramide synthase [Raphidocelis subcapitata]|uniref:Ceramide synthase n=1 Tax=Raphidocelis subcapitata TaxID=307507 RepID=A0A2V0PNG2_9CHLO|nr:ceramide synthase [Raphidocelis subcapitata]|eukprot:GBF98957.1 ceramide synthase [Raphidocelis subcapitata]
MSAPALLAAARGLLPPLEGGREDLLLPLYQGVALVALRVAVEWACLPRLRAFLKARSHGAARGAEARARDVIEQSFCAAVIAPLTAWGWWVMLRHNGPCTPAAPAGCLVGWPGHPVTGQFRWWWLTVGGMYTGEILGTLMGGVGFRLSREMMLHHVVTMALMLYGYFGGLHRYGQMATTVLDTSNALLHAAKAVHASGLPQLAGAKDGLFKLFAAVFLVVRVLLPPFSMIVPGLVYGRVLPGPTYVITNGLMLVIYSLQLMWFQKILRIAGGGADRRVVDYAATPGGTPAASPRPSKTE